MQSPPSVRARPQIFLDSTRLAHRRSARRLLCRVLPPYGLARKYFSTQLVSHTVAPQIAQTGSFPFDSRLDFCPSVFLAKKYSRDLQKSRKKSVVFPLFHPSPVPSAYFLSDSRHRIFLNIVASAACEAYRKPTRPKMTRAGLEPTSPASESVRLTALPLCHMFSHQIYSHFTHTFTPICWKGPLRCPSLASSAPCPHRARCRH